ncbi:MAG: formate C-acetyltransferase/glycerol dehydratase family glycyl radical enzyme [Synergistaceae bacterium]|jgi:formate C-acetyltransferase|nr:formate C-acetyltransferase/glycerol dehydratase family glycyl radical enzyme [Synergistaceae bacterium]
MAKNYMDRIDALRENFLNITPEMDLEPAKYLTEGFEEHEGKPWVLKKAYAFLNQCRKVSAFIQDNELLVGSAGSKARGGVLCADSCWSVVDKELDTISTRKFDPFYLREEDKTMFIEEIKPYWKGKSMFEMWRSLIPDELAALRDNGYVYIDRKAVRGYGETTPGWDRLLALGVSGIRKEIEEHMSKLDTSVPGDLEKTYFLQAELLACEGLVARANRFADKADELAASCKDSERKSELQKISAVCRRVPEYPARSFHEALQSVLFYEYAIFMEQNASSYNLGRIDQYLYPYYKADIEAGVIDKDGAQELLDCMWIKIAELSLFQDEITAKYAAGYCTTINTTPGGIDRYGNDAVNDLSYQVIQATMDVRFAEPNLSVRYNISKNPDSFLRKTAEAIRLGTGMPAVHHDDAGIRMLLNKGVPLREAWDWNPCGCVETNLSGRMKQYTDMADLNLGGMVELALNDGICRKSGKRVSVSTGSPADFKTFGDFWSAVKTHIAFATKAIAKGNQLLDYLSMNYRPVPCLSLTYRECIERGVDYSMGGAKYNAGGGVISVGIADIINSLTAVRALVFDEKKITMKQLCDALEADFNGYEDIQKMCLDAPKYGNDDERADDMVGEIFTFIADEFEKYDTKFGRMTVGILPVSGNTPLGAEVGALPSGRKAWTPLTDGIGATGGTDVNGPTALLKSVSHIPHARFTQGTQLNMKLEPAMLAGDEGIANMMNLLKSLCTLDVYHAQFNVVDEKTLRAAQERPADYKHLLVRVAGYTAFFVELGKEVQDEIIARTVIDNWAA